MKRDENWFDRFPYHGTCYVTINKVNADFMTDLMNLSLALDTYTDDNDADIKRIEFNIDVCKNYFDLRFPREFSFDVFKSDKPYKNPVDTLSIAWIKINRKNCHDVDFTKDTFMIKFDVNSTGDRILRLWLEYMDSLDKNSNILRWETKMNYIKREP